ncbi:MAG: peptide-N-glycosidase F-related protein [Fimbriimonadales bacterium]|nr:peptide-N-glycosidase F-related protein [Fimbriimonadales bacterium]
MQAWLLGVIACAALQAPTVPSEAVASWRATLSDSSRGYGVVFGEAEPKDWMEPNLEGTFAVGFDTHNPRSTDWFNADGNIYGRPEREVSLHWNGLEIANRVCPAELKGSSGHQAEVRVRLTVGGSEVTVRVNGQAVYDRFFVPNLVPPRTAPRLGPAEGARFEAPAFRSGRQVPRPEPPLRVVAFDRVLNDAQHHRWEGEAQFPDRPEQYGRVVCTLKLEPTPNGIDPWDRLAQLWLFDERGRRFEVLRWITPYRKGWTWTMDVTDLLPLFRGKRRLEGLCETWGPGWLVSVAFDFHKGRVSPRPFRVTPLWSGTAILGQREHPIAAVLPPAAVRIDGRTKAAKVRAVVTGHGMHPNTGNAAEFLPLWRKLRVGECEFQNTLWKDDNYLNPCRPQGGTWKFDRAGWAPGDTVRPWVVDVTRCAPPGREAVFRYEIQPYVNRTPEPGNPARHVVEAVLVEYR